MLTKYRRVKNLLSKLEKENKTMSQKAVFNHKSIAVRCKRLLPFPTIHLSVVYQLTVYRFTLNFADWPLRGIGPAKCGAY